MKNYVLLVVLFVAAHVNANQNESSISDKVVKSDDSQLLDVMMLSYVSDIRGMKLAISFMPSDEVHATDVLTLLVNTKLSDINYYFTSVSDSEVTGYVCDLLDVLSDSEEYCLRNGGEQLCINLVSLEKKCTLNERK